MKEIGIQRTDCHRPAELDPANYQYVGWTYQGSSNHVWHHISDRDTDFIHPETLRSHKRLFKGNYRNKHTCDHCGSAFAWGATYRHRPTNKLVVVGHICASRFNLPNKSTWIRKQIEKQVEASRNREKIQKAAQKWLDKHEDLKDVLSPDAKPDHCILQNLKVNLLHYGSLTEKQVDLARKIKKEEEQKAQQRKQWTEEAKDAEDVPEGTGIEITGVVLGTKTQQSQFAYKTTEYKMLVKDDRGFKIWGTEPSSLSIDGPSKGRRVQFTANLEKSKDDPKFGFFKRPKKAKYID